MRQFKNPRAVRQRASATWQRRAVAHDQQEYRHHHVGDRRRRQRPLLLEQPTTLIRPVLSGDRSLPPFTDVCSAGRYSFDERPFMP